MLGEKYNKTILNVTPYEEGLEQADGPGRGGDEFYRDHGLRGNLPDRYVRARILLLL